MSTRLKRPLLATSLALIIAGCATNPKPDDFSDVQAFVSERSGPRIHSREHLANERIAEATDALLQQPLTGNAAVEIAILNNPTLFAAYTQLGVARADLVEAGLLDNPMLDAELRFGEGGSGTGVELAIVQDVLGVFQIPLRKRLARAALERAKSEVAAHVLDLEKDVRQAFYAAQAAQQMIELRRTVLEATDASLDVATRLHTAGNIAPVTLSQEAALHEAALLELRSAEANVAQTRIALAELLGIAEAAETMQITERLAEPEGSAVSRQALESLAMQQRLDLQVARLNVRSAEQSLAGTRRFRLFPSAEAGGGADREAGGEWSFGPNLALPLPFFNHGQAGIARAKARLNEARGNLSAMELRVGAEVRSAHEQCESTRARAMQLRDRLLPLRHEIVQQLQRQYNAMQIGVFELLRARQEEVETGAQYVEALNDYWSAHSALRAAAGGSLPAAINVATTRPSTTPRATAPASANEHHNH